MHEASMLKMQWFVDTFISKKNLKILDIGSQDINGSYRLLFGEHNYFGLDMEPGRNVDIVVNNPYTWNVDADSFDVVISGQAFEHIEFFWITMSEMARVLKKDGLLCIIAPREFVEHRYPVDCYRFLTDGMIALARYCCLNIIHVSTYTFQNDRKVAESDSILIAKKPYDGLRFFNKDNYKCISDRKITVQNGL